MILAEPVEPFTPILKCLLWPKDPIQASARRKVLLGQHQGGHGNNQKYEHDSDRRLPSPRRPQPSLLVNRSDDRHHDAADYEQDE